MTNRHLIMYFELMDHDIGDRELLLDIFKSLAEIFKTSPKFIEAHAKTFTGGSASYFEFLGMLNKLRSEASDSVWSS